MNNESRRPPAIQRMSATKRLMWVVVGGVGLALQVVAHGLEPDPRGFGTHEQLGLTPCYFQELTGHVCPMCGSTTAWVHLHRGEFAQAAVANLGGMLLCVVVGIVSPWLLIVAVWGKWPIAEPRLKPVLVIASVWLAVVVLDWLRRIYQELM